MALHAGWACAAIAAFSTGIFAACGGSLVTDSDDTSSPVVDSGASETSAATFVTTLNANASCLPNALPTNADGTAACRILFVLPTSDESSCNVSEGLTQPSPAAPDSIAKKYPGRPVCELAELPPNDSNGGSCDRSSAAGWCYVVGAAAGADCNQSIAFSPTGVPPVGAVAVLACP